MKTAPEDKGRIVVVAAGFALWRGGRCIAAGRWADIKELRALRSTTADGPLALRLDLTDGSLLELREEAPGFDLFLDRASATLPGLLPFQQWHPALAAGAAPVEGIVLFRRALPRQPTLRR